MSTTDPARPLASRRTFLTSGTAALATAGTTAAAAVAEPDPILALIDAHREAARIADAADEELGEAGDRFQLLGGRPEIPEALYQTEQDHDTFHFYAAQRDAADARAWYRTTFIEYLRRNPPIRVQLIERPATIEDGFTEEEVASGINRMGRHVREPWPEARARAFSSLDGRTT